MVSGGPRQTPPVILHVKADALARNEVELGSPQDGTCRVLVGCGENLPRPANLDRRSRRRTWPLRTGMWGKSGSRAPAWPTATTKTRKPRRQPSRPAWPGHPVPWVRARRRPLPADRRSGVHPPEAAFRDRPAEEPDHHSRAEPLSGRHRANDQFRLRGPAGGLLRRVLDRGRGPRPVGGRPGGRTAAPRPGRRRGDPGHPHGDCRPARAGSPCGHPGQGRHRCPRPPAARRGGRRAANGICAASWKSSRPGRRPRTKRNTSLPRPRPPSPRGRRSAAEIESWLIERITARLRLAPGDVKVTTPFLELGMGSLDAVEIAAGAGALAGAAVVSHRDLQLSHDRGPGVLAGPPRRVGAGRGRLAGAPLHSSARRLGFGADCWRKSAA